MAQAPAIGASRSHNVKVANRVFKVETFDGSSLDVKLQAANDAMLNEGRGGILDARGFTGTQYLRSPVTIGDGTQPITVLWGQVLVMFEAQLWHRNYCSSRGLPMGVPSGFNLAPSSFQLANGAGSSVTDMLLFDQQCAMESILVDGNAANNSAQTNLMRWRGGFCSFSKVALQNSLGRPLFCRDINNVGAGAVLDRVWCENNGSPAEIFGTADCQLIACTFGNPYPSGSIATGESLWLNSAGATRVIGGDCNVAAVGHAGLLMTGLNGTWVGTVTVSGVNVSWASGNPFYVSAYSTDYWKGATITIAGSNHTIDHVVDDHNLVLTAGGASSGVYSVQLVIANGQTMEICELSLGASGPEILCNGWDPNGGNTSTGVPNGGAYACINNKIKAKGRGNPRNGTHASPGSVYESFLVLQDTGGNRIDIQANASDLNHPYKWAIEEQSPTGHGFLNNISYRESHIGADGDGSLSLLYFSPSVGVDDYAGTALTTMRNICLPNTQGIQIADSAGVGRLVIDLFSDNFTRVRGTPGGQIIMFLGDGVTEGMRLDQTGATPLLKVFGNIVATGTIQADSGMIGTGGSPGITKVTNAPTQITTQGGVVIGTVP